MESFHEIFLSQAKDALNLIKARCRPNPRYIHTLSQQEIVYKRNFTVLIIYTCLITTCFADIVFNHGPIVSNIVNILFAFSAIGCMFLSCRYHPEIFNIYYNLIVLVYGPSVVIAHPEEVVTVYLLVQAIPLFLHLITRSFWHFIFQAVAQNLFLNTIYQNPMKQVISYESPEDLLRHLTYSSNLTMVVQAILVVLIDRFLSEAYNQAAVLEHKKDQVENQKNFLMGFSHELRNFINSLTGNVKLASLERISDQAKDFLLNAEVCGELLLQLINNILDTGKAQIGELEVNPAPTGTFEAFERIWSVCAELIQRKNLRGHMKISKDLPRTMLIDYHRLAQIFLNLVGNSIKFTEKGSIEIKIEWIREKETIEDVSFQTYPHNSFEDQEELFEQQDFNELFDKFITLTTTDRKINKNLLRNINPVNKGILKIAITDTGCGMDEDQTSKLFQKFTQVTSDPSKRKLGTGLGLFITKQLCERMQGEIRVYSSKMKGTTFVCCIPITSVSAPTHTENLNDFESMKSFLAGKKLKALIVDDVSFNHTILRTFFEKLNIETTAIALNGLEGVQKYTQLCERGEQPQIVAMDLDMPVMDGKEASARIRRFDRDRRSDSCFLMINSGNCLESEINECLNKNGNIRADVFMKKPIKIDDLARALISHFSNNKGSGFL